LRAFIMPSYAAEIAELEQLLSSAVKDTSADGVRTSFDLDAARKRLAELKALQDPSIAKSRTSTLNLGGCW
jgi:hypothetical protein